jgi:hypothetical protein
MSIFLRGHASTPDKLQVVTSVAGDIDTYASYIDYDGSTPPVVQKMDNEQHSFTGATTNDALAGVTTATWRRVVKQFSITNAHASLANNVTVLLVPQGGTAIQIAETVTLQPGESFKYEEGVGWFPAKTPTLKLAGATNLLTGADQSLSTSDVYLNNSAITLAALGPPVIGRSFHWKFIISKTAGTGAPVVTVRTGTAGSTSDTSRLVFTWGSGTSVTDRGELELDCTFISVGGGTSAVLRGKANWTTNLTTTGLTNAVKALQPADSGGFDSTASGLIIGLSFNGSTVFAGAMEYMRCDTDQV